MARPRIEKHKNRMGAQEKRTVSRTGSRYGLKALSVISEDKKTVTVRPVEPKIGAVCVTLETKKTNHISGPATKYSVRKPTRLSKLATVKEIAKVAETVNSITTITTKSVHSKR